MSTGVAASRVTVTALAGVAKADGPNVVVVTELSAPTI
jgi:hypothetical protein